MTRAKKRIALVDHRRRDQIQTLIDDLEAAGHETKHIFREEPALAYSEILEFMPDVLCADLYFEHHDKETDPPNDWWGVKIIRLLNQGLVSYRLPIFVECKYLNADVFSVLNDLGVPSGNVGDRGQICPKVILSHLAATQ